MLEIDPQQREQALELEEAAEQSQSRLARFGRWWSSPRSWHRRIPWLPVIIIGAAVFCALFADLIAQHNPVAPSLIDRLKPPFWDQGGSMKFPLGTDSLGRDEVTRLIYGARVSLGVAFFGLLVGATIGTALGIIAGYYGGRTDAIVMRAVDATFAFPIILLALVLAVTLSPSFGNVVFVVAIVLWARFARVVRGSVLSLRERDFVALARVAGCSDLRIMLRHILPNVMNVIMVLISLNVGNVIILEASLSFLGAGVPPPTPAWGGMVAQGRDYLAQAWWLSYPPGFAILCVVLAFNSLGDWLRDYLDPRLRKF